MPARMIWKKNFIPPPALLLSKKILFNSNIVPNFIKVFFCAGLGEIQEIF